jgi:hypothetical protein
VILNVLLVADAGNEMDLLSREGLLGLFEHIGVADVEGVEHSVGVDPQYL